MRIALVSNAYPPFFIGGAEIAAHRQAVELTRSGDTVGCFCGISDPARQPYAVSEEDVDGVFVWRLNVPAENFQAVRNFSNAKVDEQFDRFLDYFRPEIVHFHNVPGLSLGMMDVCERRSIPSVVTFHDHWGFCLRNTLTRERNHEICQSTSECHLCLPHAEAFGIEMPTFMRPDMVRYKLHKASAFHFPSEYLRGAYTRENFDALRSSRHTYGIRDEWFQLVEHPEVGHPVKVVFVAYIGRHKGPDTLLEAFGLLQQRGLSDAFVIDIYGDGDQRAVVEQEVAARGWGDRVRVRGKLDIASMLTVYRDADVMLNCSRWPENEPVTILESLASGVPVIATRIGGNTELVQDGLNGWTFSPGDAAELADILVGIAQRPDKLVAMKRNARNTVADRTIGSYVNFARNLYANAKSLPLPELPSVLAVCGDLKRFNWEDLRAVRYSGYWASCEWLWEKFIVTPRDMSAISAVLSLDGQIDPALAAELPLDTPIGRVYASKIHELAPIG
jgi:glycosyltransferase involved in cell wall biosynthesis